MLMVAAGDLVKYDPFDVRVQAAAVEFYGAAVEGLSGAVGTHSVSGNVSGRLSWCLLLELGGWLPCAMAHANCML